MTGSAVFSTARRRATALTLFAFGTLIVLGAAYWVRGTPRLNLILVTFDTTRADHLGIYGYEQGLTKDFDDFAKMGVVFERAYTPAPITLPSHATMLTGLYPPEHGLRVNGMGRLTSDIPLLPEILKKHGYDTGAFVAAFVLDSKFGLERGFETYDDDLSKATMSSHFGERRRKGREVVDSALSWLRQRTSKPFFCWIHLYDAHHPQNPRPEMFGQTFETHPYDAGVAEEVQAFGQLVAFLKKYKLDHNTLVVVAGDHGEGLGEHNESDHGILVYNSTLHVPLVFSGPSECLPGVRVSQRVSLVDLFPTVLDVLRLPAPSHLSGRSLLPALSGKTLAPRPCYAESELPFDLNRCSPLRTVISDRWKLIQTTRPELYDLDSDPGETINLVESQSEESQQLRNILELMQEGFTPTKAQNLKLSEKDRAKLAALGYLTGDKSGEDPQDLTTEKLPDIKDILPLLSKFETARQLSHEGKLDETITALREILQVTDQMSQAFLLLGDCFRRQGRWDEAITVLSRLLELSPNDSIGRISLGKALAGKGQFEQAVAEFHKCIQHDPDSASAHFELATVLANQQKFDQAIIEYCEVLKIDPEFSVANTHLGILLTKLQRPKEAVAYFEKAIQQDPKNVLAHVYLLILCVQLKQYDKALKYGQKSVELDPKSFEAHFFLGSLHVSQNRYREGILQLKEAQKLRPEDLRPMQQIQQAEAALKRMGQ